MSSPVPGSTVPKAKPYRRLLTSALHSRFVRAACLTVLNGYLITIWTSRPDLFWSWFPLGPAGLKAILFSISSLFVFILQIATINIGRQTVVSPYDFAKGIFFTTSTYQAVFWYVVSAYWFCEVYIWSVPEYKQLGWIIREHSSPVGRLNERPIYLKFFFVLLGVFQSGLHLYNNYSCLHIRVTKPSSADGNDLRTHPITSIANQLWRNLPRMGKNALLLAGINTAIAPFIYRAFFRGFFWQLHLAFAKPFFDLSRTDANPPDNYFIGTILGAAFAIGTLLTFTWQLSAFAFLAFIGQEPIKDGLPLTSTTKDPNGTLLNGLAAKRDVVKGFAMWELVIIAQKHPDRRKAIFGDFERQNGPMWTSMHDAALKVIAEIDDRIVALQPAPPAPVPVKQEIHSLPRIAKDPLQQNIFATVPPPSTRTQKVENFLAMTNAKTLGQSKNPWHPPIKRTKQQLIEYAKAEVEQNKSTVTQYTKSISTGAIGGFLSSSVSARINSIILGEPVGNAAIIVDAIEAITKMLVASLNEDDYGKAVQTVPSTVKQFSRTIALIEGYVTSQAQSLQAEKKPGLEEVLIIVERLKLGLRELLSAFQIFLNDVGLGIKDLNEARRAAEDRTLVPSEEDQGQPAPEKTKSTSTTATSISADENDPPREPVGSQHVDQPAIKRLGPSRRQLTKDANVFGARDMRRQTNSQKEMEMVR